MSRKSGPLSLWERVRVRLLTHVTFHTRSRVFNKSPGIG